MGPKIGQKRVQKGVPKGVRTPDPRWSGSRIPGSMDPGSWHGSRSRGLTPKLTHFWPIFGPHFWPIHTSVSGKKGSKKGPILGPKMTQNDPKMTHFWPLFGPFWPFWTVVQINGQIGDILRHKFSPILGTFWTQKTTKKRAKNGQKWGSQKMQFTGIIAGENPDFLGVPIFTKKLTCFFWPFFSEKRGFCRSKVEKSYSDRPQAFWVQNRTFFDPFFAP